MVLEIGDCEHLADIGEEVGMGELDCFGYAFGTAGEEDYGGVIWLGFDVGWAGTQGDDYGGGELGQGGDAGFHVLEIEEFDACLLQRGDVDAAFLEEVPGGDDLFESGEVGALGQGDGSGGEVQDSGDMSCGPEAEEDDGSGPDSRQHDSHAVSVGFVELPTPHRGQGFGADEDAFVGDGATVDIVEGGLFFSGACIVDDGGEDSGGAFGHFGFELLVDHGIAEPFREELPGLGGGHAFAGGGSEGFAEVDGDVGSPLFQVGVIGEEGEADGVADVGGDDLGVGFVEEESGAFEQFHEGPCLGDAAFGEEDQSAAFLEVFCHMAGAVGGHGIHREGAAVFHDQAIDPVFFGYDTGDDEFPIRLEAYAEQEPVDEGDVVGDEQDGAGGVQALLVEGPEAEQCIQDDADDGSHG